MARSSAAGPGTRSSAFALLATLLLLLPCLDCGGRVAPTAGTGGDAGVCGSDCLDDPGTFCASGAVGCYCPAGGAPAAAAPARSCGAGTKSGSGMEYCCTGK
jgi:hypothetical protein